MTFMECSFPGCDRPPRSGRMPLCVGHYSQHIKGRELRPLQGTPVRTPLIERDGRMIRVCEALDCDAPGKKGTARYCSKHAARISRHGSPDIVIAPADRNMPRGPANPKWTKVPSYWAIHQRLVKTLGRAKTHTCQCGQPAAQWAYTGPREAGQRLPHSGDMNDYEAMCVRCHKRMDMAEIRQQEAS
jgi:hypothetical protein